MPFGVSSSLALITICCRWLIFVSIRSILVFGVCIVSFLNEELFGDWAGIGDFGEGEMESLRFVPGSLGSLDRFVLVRRMSGDID